MPHPAPSNLTQLTEAERRQIEAEELARAQAEWAQQAQTQRQQEAAHYRQAVRAELQRPPMPRSLRVARVALPLLLLLGLVGYARWPRPAEVADNTWGGISGSDLTGRCREAISAQTYGQEPDLTFPPPREAATQLSADADGKRWNGWATRPDGSRLEFACSYSAATGQLTLEVMR